MSVPRFGTIFWRYAPVVVLLLLVVSLFFTTYDGKYSDDEELITPSSSIDGIKTEEMIDRAFKLELAARRQRVQSVCRNFEADKMEFLDHDYSAVENRVPGDSIIQNVDWERVLDPNAQRLPEDPRQWAIALHTIAKFKWMFCHVAKVGSRNIIRFFVQLSNPSLSLEEIEDLKVHTRDRHKFNDVAPLFDIAKNSSKEAVKIMKTYKKFVFVRNPLDRLLSAWNDKLYSKNSFYAKKIGRKIIENYRKNASPDEIDKGYPVYLDEFLRSLLDADDKKMDHHWMPIHRASMVCAIDYDFIGHLENVEFELTYLARQMVNGVNLPKVLETESADVNRTDHRIDRYAELRKLPRRLIEVVLRRHYQVDYDLFGYSIEKDLDKVYGKN